MGILLLVDSDNYIFLVIGIYYVEVCDLVNNCVSECIVIIINENIVVFFMSLGD